MFYDDYGHHPTEVSAVLSAFKEGFPDRRLVVLFQPHRYSRTQLCWEQFLDCFKDADHLFVMDIYPAGEAVIQGVNARLLVQQMHHPNVDYLGDGGDKNIEGLGQFLRQGDVLVTLGAGNVWKTGDAVRTYLDEGVQK